MSFPDFNSTNSSIQWDRYSKLLWTDDQLGMWVDTSRMHYNSGDQQKISNKLKEALLSMRELELGAIANKDENRQVGHYWLRNPSIAPRETDSKAIKKEIEEIKLFASQIITGQIKSKDKNFTDVVWIGIGGSGLGPQLLVKSLICNNQKLKFHFLDNVDPDGINKTLDSIKGNIQSTLFVVVSKSGGTPEPLICMEQSIEFVKQNNGDWRRQAVAITMLNSKLYAQASDDNWLKIFSMQDWVGGRTSISSSVGLLTIALMNKDIDEFIRGANLMDIQTRKSEFNKNPASLLASSWYFAGEGQGKRDMVVLPYRDYLDLFSKYLQQLVMESLGKKYDRNGKKVNQGIAVYGNKGSTDQHAYVQQLRDGIDNYFAVFIEVLKDDPNIKQVNGKYPGDYLSGFYQGTRSALSESGRQSITITLNEFNEFKLGALIALFERSVGIYAEIINVNAYDQPGVEAGKVAASSIILLQDSIEKLLSEKGPMTIAEISSILSNESKESIYIILRHLSENQRVSKIGNSPTIEENKYKII